MHIESGGTIKTGGPPSTVNIEHDLSGRLQGISDEIVNAWVTNRRVVIVRRRPSNMAYGTGRQVPDTVWKEVYEVVDGEIRLTKKIEGTHKPAHTVRESIEFPNED